MVDSATDSAAIAEVKSHLALLADETGVATANTTSTLRCRAFRVANAIVPDVCR